MYFDALTLDAPKRTQDGYLAVRARAARTGVYDYLASEPSIADALPAGHSFKPTDIVKVLRDEQTVFDTRAAHSFIGKPITDDHPREAVNDGNWRDHARGIVMKALRDGEHLAFDLLLTDRATIAKVEGGKAELSNGYGATLEFGDFTAPDGTKCHARQSSISGNHVAIVDRGRAGSTCRIGDAAPCDALPSFLDSLTKEKPVKTMLIDGLTVDVSNADTAEKTINTLVAARDAANGKVAGLETQVATLTTDKATLAAEVQSLKDAKPTPAQLRDAARQFAIVTDKAKAHGVTVTDAMDEAAIIKATVLKHLGDSAASAEGWTDAQFASSFAMLKDAKTDPIRDAVRGGLHVVADEQSEYHADRAKRRAALSDAWRSPAEATA